ncbi:hypothetical protein [Arcanobacterium buesumense]|uniref:Peptidase S9 n=1 Tax=Arcanobacterium buesumense TaxID=2722751 RepID=A0A6H2EKP5_9ACTO|nr:hypothetical protein [Arcanobacterium buesumense]QJC21232.1 hypothetical protein HC352_00975 [Arcanobacterium buesumense]
MTNSANPHITRDALAVGLGVTVYYACPDMIRSRVARFFVKSVATIVPAGIVASSQLDQHKLKMCSRATETATSDVATDAEENSEQLEMTAPVFVTLGAILAGSIWLSVLTERAIFRRGERRRAKGKRFAHSRFAIVAGLASAITSYLEVRDS